MMPETQETPTADARQLLTSSRLKAARSCRRQHHLAYDLGIRPAAESEAQRFGTLFHRCLEAWWLAKQRGADAIGAALELLCATKADPFDLVRAECLIRGYDARWGDEPYEVLGVEVEFACDLVNPLTHRPSQTWRLGGKIDAIVRDLRTGRVLVVEHKTSSEDISQGGEYWRRLRMDGQVSVYFEGARSLGHDVAGCLYDVICKPSLRPSAVPLVDADGVKIVLDAAGQRVRTKDGKKWRESADSAAGYVLQTRPETPDEFRARLLDNIAADPLGYYQRGEVARLEQDMADALLDIWQLGQELREASLVQPPRFPRNPGACSQYGRTCPYFAACSGEADINDPTLFKRGEQHPELSPQH